MPNQFEKEKRDFLKKKDKSKKGSIDEDIIRLVNEINSKKDFYTTSSCAGRIVLLEMKSKKKNKCRWIFAKHGKVNFSEIFGSLKNQKFRHPIWFKQQPIILHIACRNLDAAKRLLEISRKIFRRAGIISITNRKVTIEVIGDERIETIVADKNFVANEIFVENLIKYANENFDENKKKSEKLHKLIRS